MRVARSLLCYIAHTLKSSLLQGCSLTHLDKTVRLMLALQGGARLSPGPTTRRKTRRVRYARPWMPPTTRGPAYRPRGVAIAPWVLVQAPDSTRVGQWCNGRQNSTPGSAGRGAPIRVGAARSALVDAASRSRPVAPIGGAIAAPRFHVRRAVSTRAVVKTAETGGMAVLSAFGF